MGAFHNQIRENETFDSLMELYSEALRKLKRARGSLHDAMETIKELGEQQAIDDTFWEERLEQCRRAFVDTR